MTDHDLIDAVAELLNEPSDELRDAGISNELNLQGWLGARNLRLVPADPRDAEISPGFWIAEHHDGRCVVMFDESPHAASAPVDVSPNELHRALVLVPLDPARLSGRMPQQQAGAAGIVEVLLTADHAEDAMHTPGTVEVQPGQRPEERPREAGRLPVVATLLLAGPRILELSRLDRSDLDLAARQIRMPRVKTAASERSVPMLPTLHEILLTQSAERRARKAPAFLTRNGTRQHPDNIRARLLAGVLERANTLLADREEQPIAHMTPHTLRRTFASLLAEIGVSPRRAMYLLGHTDPKFTMRVYQQVLDLGGANSGQLELVLGCAADEAFWLLSGREPRSPARQDARRAASRR